MGVMESLRSEDFMQSVDVVLMMYDGSDPYSFGYVAERQALVEAQRLLPTIYVMTKADQPVRDQDYDPSPDVFCLARGLAWPPLQLTCRPDRALDNASISHSILQQCSTIALGDLMAALVRTAKCPEVSIAQVVPGGAWTRDQKRRNRILLLFALVVGSVVFVAVRLRPQRGRSRPSIHS
eukprot:NODE_1782_length_760_cov_47.648383_g1490_i0.p1 GENE.NODE_1782_length_760_cov_47.648383_g1490_i0~~NODE_1782_length_760_cov_47.648383_g1490_i0.p1  ORF type:complete len:189 (+),score=65.08 NODE_1782_length_760_cov_47.648383_g1490_i0:29-568(+)